MSSLLHLQRAAGNRAVSGILQHRASDASASLQRKAAAPVPGVDTLLWVLDDVLDNETSRLIPDLSTTYRGTFENLFQAIAGHDLSGKKIDGRERREMFDEAVLALKPVLAHASDAQRDALQRKRTVLLRAEADDRVGNSVVVGNAAVEIPDDRHPQEQLAMLRTSMPKLRETIQMANEQVLRLGHEQVEHAIEHLYHGGQSTLLAHLAILNGLLAEADGLLALDDKELREHLTHLRGGFAGAATLAELTKKIVEVGAGTVTLLALLSAAIATAIGDASLASAALGAAGTAGELLGSIVAGVEVVHGVFVIFDSDSTSAEKEQAGLDVASGTGWLGGLAKGGKTMGAAASFAVIATYIEVKVAAYLYWEGATGLNTGLMRGGFEYLQRYGGSIARAAGSLARAGLLLQNEHDPIKAEPLAKIAAENSQMLATGMDDFLQHCLPTGKDMGWSSGDAAAFPGNVPIFAEAFAPLQGLRGATSQSAILDAAGAIIEKITWCLEHAGEIIVASTRHKHLSDVEEDDAKAASGSASE